MPQFNFISRLFRSDPVIVVPFGGYASDTKIHLKARVLEDEAIKTAEDDSFLKNLWNSYKRLESDEIAHAETRVTWGDNTQICISDKEGYITLDTDLNMEFDHEQTLWLPISFELLGTKSGNYKITTTAMKPSSTADFGIISDIDDTILETGVASTLKWRLLVNSLMKHSNKRIPLAGAQEFYHLLHQGQSGKNTNPIFYLSNSPWNLYDYLQSFLTTFQFPPGTLLLRDMGLEHARKSSFLEGNKYKKARHILQTYPDLPFVLLGDAGETDTDIYLQIAQEFPERVKAIYIRTVSKDKKVARVQKIIESQTDIQIVLTPSTEVAIKHATAQGFIVPPAAGKSEDL